MKLRASITATGSLVAALVLTSCSEPGSPAGDREIDRASDEAAIRALLEANWTASSAQDAEGVQATYLPDGDAWIAGLSRTSGADDLRRAEEEFGGMPGFQSYDGTIDSVRFVSPDAAIVEVSGTTTLDSGSFDEEVTIVVARRDDNWGIAAWRVMTFDETLLSMLRE